MLLGPVSAGRATPDGAVVSLKNSGTSNITTAAVGFDTVSGGNPIRFWYEGRLVDRDNPLPTGETACTQPSPDISSDSRLSLDQVGSFETVYLDIISSNGETSRLDVDGEEIEFDFTDDGSGIAGVLGVVSTSPCEVSSQLLPEGPKSPEGLSGEASDSHPGTITLEWDDSAESDIFGYAVYVSRNSNGPFVRQAWLLSDSAHADGRTTDGASYYYAVAAINSWGLESPKSSVLRVPSRGLHSAGAAIRPQRRSRRPFLGQRPAFMEREPFSRPERLPGLPAGRGRAAFSGNGPAVRAGV